MRCLFEGGAYSKIGRGKKKTLKKCKLMIIVVNALSYPWYCLTTDQLFHRRATQTNETNITNASCVFSCLLGNLVYDTLMSGSEGRWH